MQSAPTSRAGLGSNPIVRKRRAPVLGGVAVAVLYPGRVCRAARGWTPRCCQYPFPMHAPSAAPVMTWHEPVLASTAPHVWHTAQSADVAQLFLRHSPGAP